MLTRITVLLATLSIGVLTWGPVAAGVNLNIKVPFAQVVFVPCANDGAGEFLTISGSLHLLLTATEDSAGGQHLTFHFQPQGASGVGEDTGDLYRANGVTRGATHVIQGDFPFIDTFVNNFRMIGTAGGAKFKVHNTVHVTINANGELSADVDNSSVTCR